MDSASFGPTGIPASTGDSTFAGLVDGFISAINNAFIPLLIALLLVFIIWKSVDTLILHADDEQKRAEGKSVILISIVVMAMVIAFWGIIAFVQRSILG